MERVWTLLVVCGLLAVAGCATPEQQAPSTPPSGSVTATPSRRPPAGTPAASPTLIVFVQVGTDIDDDLAGEVTDVTDLDRFLLGPESTDRQVRDAVRRHRATGMRLFAFLLSGCQNDGAALVIRPNRVYAVLTDGESVRCVVADAYLAVFAVPGHLVPDGARIG